MGKKRRKREIVAVNGFNIELNNEDNKVGDQIKRMIKYTDEFLQNNL